MRLGNIAVKALPTPSLGTPIGTKGTGGSLPTKMAAPSVSKISIRPVKSGGFKMTHFSQQGLQSPRPFIAENGDALLRHVRRYAGIMKPSLHVRLAHNLG